MSRIANGERSRQSDARSAASLNKLRQLKTTEKAQGGGECNLRTLSRECDCLAKIGTKEAFTLLLEKKGQHAPTQTDNQRQKYMKKTHLLLRIFAVISRYGSHLMIVMIFVTQNNF